MTNPNNIFNEQMTSNEARMAFFKAVEGKTKAEIEQIKRVLGKQVNKKMLFVPHTYLKNEI